MRAGVDTPGATLDHDPRRAVTGRVRHRRGDLPGAAGLDYRHIAAAAQHIGGAGPDRVGSRSMEPPPSDRTERSAVARAGDGLWTRPPLLSRSTVLAGGHDGGYHTPVAHLRDDTVLDVASATGAGPDRWCGTGSRTVSGRLRQLAAVTRCFAARWPGRSSSAECRAGPIRRRPPSGSGAAVPPEDGSAAPDTGSG